MSERNNTEMGEHMKESQAFLKEFTRKIDFPAEAQEVYENILQRILTESDYVGGIISSADLFRNQKYKEAFDAADRLADEMGIHRYTLSMLLLILCAEPLLLQYREKGVPEEIYWNSMKDLRYKLLECHKVYGIWGTFVRDWYPRFYQVDRFALGRIQYEFSVLQLEDYEIKGITVKTGDKVLNMHIPSSGAFTEEMRLDSYKKAYAFFNSEFGGKAIPMVCSSWLLYQGNKEFLPENSNILGFMEDFTYIKSTAEEKFHDAWRVFGKDAEKGPQGWPRESTLQKRLAEYLERGGKTGSGYGIFLFDGEKIVR